MRVRIIGSVQGADTHLLHGDIVDLDAHVAEAWLADGHASSVDQDTPTTAEWPSSFAIAEAQAGVSLPVGSETALVGPDVDLSAATLTEIAESADTSRPAEDKA